MKDRGYRAVKEAIYSYCDLIRRSPLGPSSPAEASQLENALREMDQRHCSLAVVGEVKAGKSTFINALLGEEVMGAHCLQCTNAIIEVFHSDTRFLRVRYGDGHVETVLDDELTPDADEAAQRLQEISQVAPKYRTIPTTVIDGFLLRGITDPDLGELERLAQIPNLADEHSLIREYIAEFKDCARIPVRIEYGSPALPALGSVRLVDTPGVNALGGIQHKTLDYLSGADAVLLLHRTTPIESKTFADLYQKIGTLIDREKLFLILSHAADHSKDELDAIIDEARSLFPAVPSERIKAVDSALKLVERKLNNGTLTDLMKEPNCRLLLAPYALRCDNDPERIVPLLAGDAQFAPVETMIREFSKDVLVRRFGSCVNKLSAYVAEKEKDCAGQVGANGSRSGWSVELRRTAQRMERILADYTLLGDGVVCFGGRDGLVFVDSLTGLEIRRFRTPEPVTTPPIVARGMALFGRLDNKFCALNIESGVEQWTITTTRPILLEPVVWDPMVFIVSKDGVLYAADMESGEVKWIFQSKWRVRGVPAVRAGLVYFGTSDGVVCALDALTGKLRWQFDKKDWQHGAPRFAPAYGE